MSMKRVSAELEEVPTEEFCAGAANVLFRLPHTDLTLIIISLKITHI